MQHLLNIRPWISKSNTVTPIATNSETHCANKYDTTTATACSASSVKHLIPSLSSFNLPPSITTAKVASNLALFPSLSSCSSSSSSCLGHNDMTSAISEGETRHLELHKTPSPTAGLEHEIPPPVFACHQYTAYPITLDRYSSPGLQEQTGGIQPVRLLMERLEAWQYVTKCLYHHFEELATVESSFAKSYHKLESLLELERHSVHHLQGDSHRRPAADPSGRISDINITAKDTNCNIMLSQITAHDTSSSNARQHSTLANRKKSGFPSSSMEHHFAKTGNGGIRQVCSAWQMYHLKNAKDHADYASFIRTQGLPLLANIRHELKSLIRSVRSDDRLSHTHLTKLKVEAAKRLTHLDQQLTFFVLHPHHGATKEDPWLMNTRVIKQMLKVYQQENKMHETVVRLQREVMALEKQLMDDLRQFCQQLYTLRESSWLGADKGLHEITRTFDNMANDDDWRAFTEQSKDQLVSEGASYRHPDKLQYPNHNHPLVKPLFAARMERRSSVLHNWHEHIYVLTSAGFLHEYRNPRAYPYHPTATFFVPEYNATTLSTNRHHDLVFQLQPYALSPSFSRLGSSSSWNGKKGSSTCQNQSFRRGSRPKRNVTLRAKCAQDMQIWMEHLTVCSHRYRPMMQYPQQSFGGPMSSIGTASPTLVNQDLASPRWLLSPAPVSRDSNTATVASNHNTTTGVTLTESSPTTVDMEAVTSSSPMVIGVNTTGSSRVSLTSDDHQEQQEQQQETSTPGLSVLADFISFATKQLVSNQCEQKDKKDIKNLETTAELPSSSSSSMSPTSVTEQVPETGSTADQMPEEDHKPSILTGVRYPSD